MDTPPDSLESTLAEAVTGRLMRGESVDLSPLGRLEVTYQPSTTETDEDAPPRIIPPRQTITFTPHSDSDATS